MKLGRSRCPQAPKRGSRALPTSWLRLARSGTSHRKSERPGCAEWSVSAEISSRRARSSLAGRKRRSRPRSGALAAEATLVFDACAVIAMLRGEEGAETAASLLGEPKNLCRLHAVNLCEVYYDGLRRGDTADAARLEKLLTNSGF